MSRPLWRVETCLWRVENSHTHMTLIMCLLRIDYSTVEYHTAPCAHDSHVAHAHSTQECSTAPTHNTTLHAHSLKPRCTLVKGSGLLHPHAHPCDLLRVGLPLRCQVLLHRDKLHRLARLAARSLAHVVPRSYPFLEIWPVLAKCRDLLGACRVCRLLRWSGLPAVRLLGRLPREVLRSDVFPPAQRGEGRAGVWER